MECFVVLGLMSGTSLDGIDVALIKTDGYVINERIAFITYPYSNNFRKKVKSIFGSTIKTDTIKQIENELTLFHHEAILYFCKTNKLNLDDIDLISFHGQTIYHKSLLLTDDNDEEIKSNLLPSSDIIKGKNCESWQIGDAQLLFEKLQIPIIYNLRYNDILNGGQGAPLSPIYHAAISITKYINDDILEFPIIFINIGGISNVTFIDIKQDVISLNDIKIKIKNDQHSAVKLLYDNLILKAFDVGPGNSILNDWIEYATNNQYHYDKDAMYSMNGCVDTKDIEFFVKQFICHSFFDLKPPKSLDRNDLHEHLWRILGIDSIQQKQNEKQLCYIPVAKICNIAQIIVECTCYSIVNQITKYCYDNIKNIKDNEMWLISGGGRRNPYIMKCIDKYCNLNNKNTIKVMPIERIGYDGDAIEAELWGFLAVRSKQNIYISFPETTGVDKPISGGQLIQ